MDIKQKIIYLYSFILGLFGFSIFGQYLELNVLKLPYYFVEIFFIPAILMNFSSILGCFRKVRYTTVFLLIFLFMSLFSNIIYTGQVFSAIFAYRAILYLLFCLCYFRKYKKDIPMNLFFTIALGAVCGELIYVLELATSAITSSVNCLAISIVIWIPYLQKKYILTGTLVLTTLFLAINTGFRIGIIVVVFTIFNLFIYALVNSKQNTKLGQKIRLMLFFGIGFLGIIYFISNLYAIVEKVATSTGMSSFAVFRVTTRLESLLNIDFLTSQDTARLDMVNVLYERIWRVLPRGLLGFVDGGIEYSYYIDIPPSYLFEIFGSVVTIIIVVYFFMQFVIQAKTFKVDSQVKKLAIWLIPLLGLLFLTNGTFMVNTSQAIITGTILGYVTRKSTVK